jgi:ribosomal protein S8E
MKRREKEKTGQEYSTIRRKRKMEKGGREERKGIVEEEERIRIRVRNERQNTD